MSAAASNVPEPERLYRIGDVSRLTDTKPFVLRFWETEFPMLQPVKAPKGHRLYRQSDIELIREIKRLLYEEGFTIAGARRHLTEALGAGAASASLPARSPLLVSSAEFTDRQPAATASLSSATEGAALSVEARRALVAVRQELRAILTLLGAR